MYDKNHIKYHRKIKELENKINYLNSILKLTEYCINNKDELISSNEEIFSDIDLFSDKYILCLLYNIDISYLKTTNSNFFPLIERNLNNTDPAIRMYAIASLIKLFPNKAKLYLNEILNTEKNTIIIAVINSFCENYLI